MLLSTTPGLDPLRPPSLAARAVVVIVAGALLAGLGWSTVVKLDVSATGTGRIVPSREVQIVQNLEGGIIKASLVRAGDRVKQGQVVARIQDTEFNATYGEAKETAAGYQAAIARLTAEAEGHRPRFPAWLEAEHPDLVSKELKLYESRVGELESTIRGDQEAASRARNERAKAQESLPIMEQQLELAQEQKGIVQPQVDKGLISRVELLGIEQRILELEGKMNETQRAIPGATSAAREAEARIASARAKYRSDALGRLMEAKVKMSGLSKQMEAHKDRVTRREVRSPVNGIVKKSFIHTTGGVVRPGESLFEIVPTDDELVVEAKFSPKDIAFIHPGQKAFIRITAYDASIYGALPAEVTQVSADASENQREEVFYLLKVRATGGFANQANPLPLLPGMVAQVDVVTTQRTLFDYLVKPLTKLRYTALHER